MHKVFRGDLFANFASMTEEGNLSVDTTHISRKNGINISPKHPFSSCLFSTSMPKPISFWNDGTWLWNNIAPTTKLCYINTCEREKGRGRDQRKKTRKRRRRGREKRRKAFLRFKACKIKAPSLSLNLVAATTASAKTS